jgi:cytochrome b subunit of formate dehydrogenase
VSASAALLLLGGSLGQAAESCFACHAAPGLEERIQEGQTTTPEREAAIIKGKAHAGLTCLQCHPKAAEAPHSSPPGAVACDSCHKGYRGHVVAPADRQQQPGSSIHIPVCVDCHGSHGILSPTDPASPVSRERVTSLCGKCHGPNSARPYAASYLESVHGRAHAKAPGGPAAVCTDCHGAHSKQEGETIITPVSRPHLPATCGKCHTQEAAQYRDSSHGRAMAAHLQEAAVCTDCHGEHDIQAVTSPGSPAYVARISETCAKCHANARIVKLRGLPGDRVTSYKASYHGAANQWGDIRVANCTSCHGAHDILPASDPRSTVNPSNLSQTCGRCHEGTRLKYTVGDVHVGAKSTSARVVKWIRVIYLLLIGGTLAALTGYIIFDLLAFVRWKRQGGRERFQEELEHLPKPPESALLRLTRNERLQHWVLLVSFTALALSGLPLLAPSHPICRILVALCGGPGGRYIVHRVAAVGLLGGSAYHLWYLFFAPRGRQWLRDMLPTKQDVLDVWITVKYFFGLSEERPQFGRFGFPEKFEYGGVVWGTFIMGLTGFVMWFENLSLRYLPKWAWDGGQAIHGWEAILAVSVILLWHMYHTVWKPAVLPMNRAWLDGKMVFELLVEEHPRVYAEIMKEVGEKPAAPEKANGEGTDPGDKG